MARLPVAPKYGWLAKLMFWLGKRKLGRLPTPWRMTGLHPAVFFGSNLMMMVQQGTRTVDPVVKSLARIQTARLVGCLF